MKSPSDLRALIAGVQLRDVRLIEASVRTRVRDVSKVANPHLVANHGTSVLQRAENAFLVAVMLRAHIGTEGGELNDATPVAMQVTFALEYAVQSLESFSDEILAEFARVNAAFNAWPYLREYVQTTSARMNLPPIVLPVFRVVPQTAVSSRQESDQPIRTTKNIGAPEPKASSRKKQRKPRSR